MRSFRKIRQPMTLQLTSLLDMFTIILVFLLQSFQAEDEELVLHAGLELPSSDARFPLAKGVHVAIAPDGVFIEGDQVVELSDGEVLRSVPGELEMAEVVAAISAVLETEEISGDIATIQADRAVPYDTVDRVMRSAARAGCGRFRIVIGKE